MKRPLSSNAKRRVCLTAMLLCLGVVLLWRTALPKPQDPIVASLWDTAMVRTAASVVIALLLWYLEIPVFHPTKSPLARTERRKRWCVWLPALLVCLNNAPWLSLLQKQAYLTRTDLLWLWIWTCLGIACFEEFAFRGLLLRLWLDRRGSHRVWEAVIVSSGVFALFHLTNLLQGASLPATLLQVGYSFLIGAMCAIVLLATGSVWHCVLLHAVYDFGGGLISHLGGGRIWTTPTVIVTAALAVLVIGWFLRILWQWTRQATPSKE